MLEYKLECTHTMRGHMWEKEVTDGKYFRAKDDNEAKEKAKEEMMHSGQYKLFREIPLK